MARKIVVAGATGHIGRLLCRMLSQTSTQAFQIIALTRSPTSPPATELSALHNVQVVHCDLDYQSSVENLFTEGQVDAVFAVFQFEGLGKAERKPCTQGTTLLEAVKSHGVKQFVYVGADVGGQEGTDDLIARGLQNGKVDFESKIRASDIPSWTILRPTFFMENYLNFLGSVTAALQQASLPMGTNLQLISIQDIARVAHAVLLDPVRFHGKSTSVVSETLTFSQMNESYRKASGGYALTRLPTLAVWPLARFNPLVRGLMDECLRASKLSLVRPGGPNANGQLAREAVPDMLTFEQWAATTMVPATSSEEQGDWNGRWRALLLMT